MQFKSVRSVARMMGSPRRLTWAIAIAALLNFPLMLLGAEANAMKIQSVKSPGGIQAWLVEEHSVPLMAMRFVFDGGSAQDPAGKEGLANFLSGMLDEGAGDLTSTAFQEQLEELAVKISFDDARDSLYGNFETLTANRERGAELLRLALTKPRFDADAVERVRNQLLANLAYAAKSPDKVAAKAWSARAFEGHPYGRSTDGTPETLQKISRQDLENYRKRVFARDTLKVVAVGDIDAAALGSLLDKVFGQLAAKAQLDKVSLKTPAAKDKLEVIEMDVPQSVAQFGLPGIPRKDPDFLAAFVLNQIVGGGGFASRLTEEVREKRGLAYSVYSYLQPYKHAPIFGGGVATKNEEIAQSLDVIRAELKRMAEEGPTQAELDNAKKYLTGSFALRFDSNSKIANQLLWMLQEDMGIDYVDKRNALVEAVTLEDTKRVAKRLLKTDDLIITVVGKPKGLSPRG
jgi:zinc protease